MDIPFNNIQIFNVQNYTEIDVRQPVDRLKNKLTCGDHQIPSFLIKDYFGALSVPLLTLFNFILSTYTFPAIWKVIRDKFPFLKSGNPDIKSYRPILSNIVKVFEMSLYTHIYTNAKSCISSNQHGFADHGSTVRNLVKFTQFLIILTKKTK